MTKKTVEIDDNPAPQKKQIAVLSPSQGPEKTQVSWIKVFTTDDEDRLEIQISAAGVTDTMIANRKEAESLAKAILAPSSATKD